MEQKKYRVVIEEVRRAYVEVRALNKEDAYNKVADRYENDEISQEDFEFWDSDLIEAEEIADD